MRFSSIARISQFLNSFVRSSIVRELHSLGALRSFMFIKISPQAGNGLPFVSSPKGKSRSPTTKAKAVRATGVPRV